MTTSKRIHKMMILLAGALAAQAFASARALGQGCVIARQSAPAPGLVGSPYLAPGEWQLSVGYRWFRSDRHFVGRVEQTERQAEGSEVINDVSLFDLDASFALSSRLSLGFGLPYLMAERSQPVRDVSREVVGRNRTSARGIGDLVVSARSWLLEPSRHERGNVLLIGGVKLPTGSDNLQDNFRALDGTTAIRTVDQSIQPGDGGVGVVLGVQSFLHLSPVTLYAAGTYLLNPRGSNGVPTYRGRASEAFMSVPDAYIARGGALVRLPWIESLAVGAGMRVEGVPADDLIGSSAGFRRPGYTVSFEPGLSYAFSSLTLSASVPIALVRDRTVSAADRLDGSHGDAAFADFSLLLGLAYRPSGRPSAIVEKQPAPAREPTAAAPGLHDPVGQAVDLGLLLGRRLSVVNLWASWCEPCRSEIPTLVEAHRRFRQRGVSFVGIAVKDEATQVTEAARALAIEYPVLLGDDATVDFFHADMVPTTVILDERGRVLETFRGPLEGARLVAALEARLGTGRVQDGAAAPGLAERSLPAFMRSSSP